MKKGTTTTVKATSAPVVDIFAQASGTAKAKTPVKDEKETVVLKDPNFYQTLSRFAEIAGEIKTREAEQKLLHGTIKETGKEQMLKLYDSTGKFPGSFNIQAKDKDGKKSASFMFITMDSYASIDEERANELKSKFGESIIEKTTTYIVNSAMIEKYRAVISAFVMTCPDIHDEDRAEIIKATNVLEVAPGTIEKLKEIKGKKSDIIAEIVPTFQVKGVKNDK